jgi:hypothetical protein
MQMYEDERDFVDRRSLSYRVLKLNLIALNSDDNPYCDGCLLSHPPTGEGSLSAKEIR